MKEIEPFNSIQNKDKNDKQTQIYFGNTLTVE